MSAPVILISINLKLGRSKVWMSPCGATSRCEAGSGADGGGLRALAF
jgi:hypothetical protein